MKIVDFETIKTWTVKDIETYYYCLYDFITSHNNLNNLQKNKYEIHFNKVWEYLRNF